MRGLHILRSDTDRWSMVALGNLFTHYGYRRGHVSIAADESKLSVKVRTPSREADLRLEADLASRPAPLPPGSPLRTMEAARQFAGPLPFTFGYDPALNRMIVVKGVRKVWNPEPVSVQVHEATFLDQSALAGARPRLANAFYLEKVPYCWMPGVLEALP